MKSAFYAFIAVLMFVLGATLSLYAFAGNENKWTLGVPSLVATALAVILLLLVLFPEKNGSAKS